MRSLTTHTVHSPVELLRGRPRSLVPSKRRDGRGNIVDMGSDFRSFCIRKGDHEKVAGVVRHWLEARGFEPHERQEILQLSEDSERGFCLYWNDDWTVLLYSHFEEDERLSLELQKLGRPVLHLWLHDSDVWGYELTVDGSELTSFNSNPRYFGAEETAESPNDTEVLLAKLGIEQLSAKDVRRLQAKRGLFKEVACEAFARALGVGPAASQYSYALEEPPPDLDSFRYHVWRFRRPGFDPMAGFDLRATRAQRAEQSSAMARPPRPLWHLLLRGVLRVLFLPFEIVSRVRRWTGGGPSTPESWVDVGVTEENGFLVDRTRSLRVRKVAGLEPRLGPGGLPIAIDGSPLWFQALDGDTARTRITRIRDEIQAEEDLEIGAWPAKRVRTVSGDGKESVWRESYYVQAPTAVLLFDWWTNDREHEAGFRCLREVVESLELLSEERRR